MDEFAELSSAGENGLDCSVYGQSFPKRNEFWDSNTWAISEYGYQWVDDMDEPLTAQTADTYIEPTGTSQMPSPAQNQQQLYQYPQGGTQWVDHTALLSAASQPIQQDMIFQWVDLPCQQPRQFAQAQVAAPSSHYPIADSSFGLPRQSGMLEQSSEFNGGGYGDSSWPPHSSPDARNSYWSNGLATKRTDRPKQNDGGYAERLRKVDDPAQYDGNGWRPVGDDADSRGKSGGRPAPDGNRVQGRSVSPDLSLVELEPENLRTMLTETLESLYADRIKPMANYIKGRLKEKSCPEAIVKNFFELYEQHTDLFEVQRPASGSPQDEATVLLVDEPDGFKGWVDIDSTFDPYEEKMWEAFGRFLGGEHTFAGGRYGMARELIRRELDFIRDYTLGEVCHIVQLAIQTRRLIVYHRKMLKPIQTVLGPQSGDERPSQRPENTSGEDIKSMDDLCLVLFRMLMHHSQGLRLCRLKQMIKHEFCRTLSEMSFHCTKLVELFNIEPLADTFVLDTENDGKSIYVRLGNPDRFNDQMRKIYLMALAAENSRAHASDP